MHQDVCAFELIWLDWNLWCSWQWCRFQYWVTCLYGKPTSCMISSVWSDPISSPALFYNTLTTVSQPAARRQCFQRLSLKPFIWCVHKLTKTHTRTVKLIMLWCAGIWESRIVWTGVSRFIVFVWLPHRSYTSFLLSFCSDCVSLSQSLCSRTLVCCIKLAFSLWQSLFHMSYCLYLYIYFIYTFRTILMYACIQCIHFNKQTHTRHPKPHSPLTINKSLIFQKSKKTEQLSHM